MKSNGRNRLAIALGLAAQGALLPALALAPFAAMPAVAQDTLPSVGDYRFPRARPSETARPQGPVDEDAPVVRAIPTAAAPEAEETTPLPRPAPSVTASAVPSAAASAKPKPAASPVRAAPTAAVTASAAPKPATTAATSSPAATAAGTAAPQPVAIASPISPSPVAAPSITLPSPVPQINWRVHSARDALAEQAARRSDVLPGLLGLGSILLGLSLAYLLKQVLRRRRQRAAEQAAADWSFIDAPADPDHALIISDPAELPAVAMVDDGVTAAAAETPVFFEKPDTASEQQPIQPTLDAVPNLSLGPFAAPLELALAARRMSATLMNTVLNYELVVTNNGQDVIGPIQIGGDMISAHASLPTRSQLELTGQSITPLHTLPALLPGASATMTGELRLALAAITPIRSGNTSLFVPLARFRLEALRKGAPPIVINHTSVIGESQDDPRAALKPFRLDLGPRLYSEISQRELALTA